MIEEEGTLKENAEDYIETRIDIIKLKAIQKSGVALSGLITGVLTAFIGLFVLVFLSFSAAFAVAELIGKNSLGFLAIAGFYTLLGVVLLTLKEKIITMPVINALIKKFYEKDEVESEK
jgi:hypothetical protein